MNAKEPNAKRITDLSYLASICDDDPVFKQEMIETFLKNTPPMIHEMKDLAKISEWKKVGDIAHKIKPSITFMGIHSAKDLILDLEKNGRQHEETDKIASMVNRFEEICNMAFAELLEELRDL